MDNHVLYPSISLVRYIYIHIHMYIYIYMYRYISIYICMYMEYSQLWVTIHLLHAKYWSFPLAASVLSATERARRPASRTLGMPMGVVGGWLISSPTVIIIPSKWGSRSPYSNQSARVFLMAHLMNKLGVDLSWVDLFDPEVSLLERP